MIKETSFERKGLFAGSSLGELIGGACEQPVWKQLRESFFSFVHLSYLSGVKIS
jgi:hypothetical protein